MPLQHHKPVTPTQRFLVRNKADVSKKRPERLLTEFKHRAKGRNCYGRITSRRRGGGHRKLYRIVDFRRDKYDIPGRVDAIEYDPNRSANLALIVYADGEKRYILAPENVNVGDVLLNLTKANGDFNPGYNMPLSEMPPSTSVHNIELFAGRGAKLARAAGQSAQLINVEKGKASIKLPSGEIRLLDARCRATIGSVGNRSHQNRTIGKAGRSRWLGKRPRVRGVAMNPVDHPMGGGEGRTSGGGHPMSPWGQLAKGKPTRRRSKQSNSQILVRRNGKKMRG
ncbi:MAG: 50S ribosomal protein L2 [Opitutales bacterium]|nr:50S ribosomal protein L2 [Opitutales bacterium]NRA26175.1 50S ribosomal protein L2 [Opitutales bacterium]